MTPTEYGEVCDGCGKLLICRSCGRFRSPALAQAVGMREALIAAKCTSPDGTFVHASMEDVLRAAQPPAAPVETARIPKVRTSHHRNKEEAARLQALVNERHNGSSAEIGGAKAPFRFRRYVNGVEMAEDVEISYASTVQEAFAKARAMYGRPAGMDLVLEQVPAEPQPSAGNVDAIAKTIWLSEFERAFSRTPSDPWENQSDKIKDGHRLTAQRLIDAGFVTATGPQRSADTAQEHLQSRGRHYDIIREAIVAYDEFMLDDDYDAQRTLDLIIKKMRERVEMTDAPTVTINEPQTAPQIVTAAKNAVKAFKTPNSDRFYGTMKELESALALSRPQSGGQ